MSASRKLAERLEARPPLDLGLFTETLQKPAKASAEARTESAASLLCAALDAFAALSEAEPDPITQAEREAIQAEGQ